MTWVSLEGSEIPGTVAKAVVARAVTSLNSELKSWAVSKNTGEDRFALAASLVEGVADGNAAVPAVPRGVCLRWLSGDGGDGSKGAVTMLRWNREEGIVQAKIRLRTAQWATMGTQDFDVMFRHVGEGGGLGEGAAEGGAAEGGAAEVAAALNTKGEMEVGDLRQLSKWQKYKACAPEGAPLHICACH